MIDFNSQYEKYKKSLLQNHGFIKGLHEKYIGSLSSKKDYIDQNGILWKTGLLGAFCGFCLAFMPVTNGNWILGIILFLVICGSIICAGCIGSKFKKDLGELDFYSFHYPNHFSAHIQTDKENETRELLSNIAKQYESFLWRVDSIPDMTKEDIEGLFFIHLKEMGDHYKRIEALSRYDRFKSEIKNDYYFNSEMQKDIDKYI